MWDVLPADGRADRYHRERAGYWVAYCRDTRYRKNKPAPPFRVATGPTAADALEELARCIQERLEGRAPK